MRLRKEKRKEGKQQKVKLTWKQRIIYAVIYIIVGFLSLSVFIAIFAHERGEETKKKKEIVQSCYETMYIASGYTLSYTIDVSYLIKYSDYTTASTVSLAYQAKEEVDQVNQKKKITLISSGRVADTDIYEHQVLYYGDGRMIQQEYSSIGDLLSTKEEPAEVTFDYNPMLTFASVILEKPGEFRIKNDNKTITGSISLKDISSFLNLFPYSALFSGIEDNKYFTDQVNKITITNDNGYFKSAVLDLKNIASTLISPFYNEVGASVEVSQYTITIYMESWEQPTIVLPEGEINSAKETAS